MNQPFDWVIIGGGVHGVHLATRLIAEAGVAHEQIRIIDPAHQLMDAWRHCAANTGMTHLRSPAVHHLGLGPWSLLKFAGIPGTRRRGKSTVFQGPYNRPTVGLFEAHSDDVIARYNLASLHIQDRAEQVSLDCDKAMVKLAGGETLTAQHVLLALGGSDQPRWPRWATAARDAGCRIEHIFDRDFSLNPEEWPERVAVIGGGISAIQTAIRLATKGRTVHVVSRHALRKHKFDSDPGWTGPKNMRAFDAISCTEERRRQIKKARHNGSLPPDLYRAFRKLVTAGTLTWHEGQMEGDSTNGTLALTVADQTLQVDAALLATGFESARPGGSLVDDLATRNDLPCATCGFPIVDKHLRWHPRVFVSGPLAELEVGPVARNIIGARRAAERIVPIARAS